MKLLIVVFLAGYVVKCDDSYYVIQMPDNELRQPKRPFHVYWNVPTMQCTSKKILFKNLNENFGIIQNENDSFRGDKIAILYDPGKFPAIFNEGGGKVRYRNGGVPQEGNLKEHLDAFRYIMGQSIPDKEFSGIGIIDFESWRPVFRQNFGVLTPYKDLSFEIESEAHWWWPKMWIQAEAKKRFEEAGRIFMQNTISVAKQLRPNARWGYYGFPYCFNMAAGNMVERCADKVNVENDNIDWLWSESSALYPSVYSSQTLSSNQLAQLVRGRVKEASRVKREGTVVLPYFWFRYRDGGFLRKEDLHTVLETFQETKASGFLIWGSSSDVNTVEKCIKLLNYTENVLGPVIAKYTKKHKHVPDVQNNENYTIESTYNSSSTTINPFVLDTLLNITNASSATFVNTSIIDPDYNFVPPENYTQEIIKLAEEITQNDTRIVKEPDTIKNDSILIDILKKIISQIELDSNSSKITNELEPPTASINTYNLETSTYVDIGESTTKSIELLSTTENYKTTTYFENVNVYSTTEEQPLQTTEFYDKSTTNRIFFNEDTIFNPELDYTAAKIFDEEERIEPKEYIEFTTTLNFFNDPKDIKQIYQQITDKTTTDSILIKSFKNVKTNHYKLKKQASLEILHTHDNHKEENVVTTELNVITKNPLAPEIDEVISTTEIDKPFVETVQIEKEELKQSVSKQNPRKTEVNHNHYFGNIVNTSDYTTKNESKDSRTEQESISEYEEIPAETLSKHDQVVVRII